MKVNRSERNNKAKGFTLIEMIGVLAVIAILAALLVPKVFGAINDAKINSTIIGCETVKTAIVDHYGKAGRFDQTVSGGPIAGWTAGAAGSVALAGYDTNVLTAEGLLEKGFSSKVGTNSFIQARVCAAAGAVTPGNGAYALSGSATNEVQGQYVLEAVIQGVPEADAQALSQRLDGAQQSTALGTSDTVGRVQYATGNPTTVYIYITHR